VTGANRHAELARRGVEMFNGRDFGHLSEIAHDDVVWRPALGQLEDREYRGLEGFVEYTRDIGASFQDERFEIESIRPVGDDAVIVFGRLHGTGARSGVAVSGERGVVIRFRDGKIAAMESFPSAAEALHAVEEGAA
jgi:ketosteroid isomerase-like protein